uniref:50S ribosomal protein L9, chloroplastic n=1 Tax=Erythrocystis saccata TaxID=2822695 RepID=A0A8E6L290_9FLOR|nr:ribosomal protein L9 [Erythrocystis saccata]
MKKKIQIILHNQKQSLINVSKGYAFNYLIPKGKATIPTKKRIKHIEMFQQIDREKEKIHKVNIKRITKTLGNINKISITKKSGESNLIFGSITEKEISQWIFKYTYIEISKNQIKKDNIKEIGRTNLNININQNTSKELQINIIPVNI